MTDPAQALVVIDMQIGFDDPRWGHRNNLGAELSALRLVRHWRNRGRQVVFVRHDSADRQSSLFPGSPGNALKP